MMRTIAYFMIALLGLAAHAHAQVRHHPAPKPKSSTSRSSESPAADDTGTSAQPEATTPTASPQPSPTTSTPRASEPAAAPSNQAPSTQSAAPKDSAPPAGDTSLQQDLAQLMDDLVQARARVAVLGKSLFKTRVRVKVDNRAAPDQVAVRIALWLDGAPIWSGDGAAVRSKERALFDSFAAPGPHTLTAEVEQRARDDEAYRYTLHESYRFMVVREKRTDVELVLDDDSDMAEDFPDDQEGKYDVRTRLKVRAVGLNEE